MPFSLCRLFPKKDVSGSFIKRAAASRGKAFKHATSTALAFYSSSAWDIKWSRSIFFQTLDKEFVYEVALNRIKLTSWAELFKQSALPPIVFRSSLEAHFSSRSLKGPRPTDRPGIARGEICFNLCLRESGSPRTAQQTFLIYDGILILTSASGVAAPRCRCRFWCWRRRGGGRGWSRGPGAGSSCCRLGIRD